MGIDKRKLESFLRELVALEEKHGIYIGADYEETLDYNWDEEPYISSISVYLIFTDKDGNETRWAI